MNSQPLKRTRLYPSVYNSARHLSLPQCTQRFVVFDGGCLMIGAGVFMGCWYTAHHTNRRLRTGPGYNEGIMLGPVLNGVKATGWHNLIFLDGNPIPDRSPMVLETLRNQEISKLFIFLFLRLLQI